MPANVIIQRSSMLSGLGAAVPPLVTVEQAEKPSIAPMVFNGVGVGSMVVGAVLFASGARVVGAVAGVVGLGLVATGLAKSLYKGPAVWEPGSRADEWALPTFRTVGGASSIVPRDDK